VSEKVVVIRFGCPTLVDESEVQKGEKSYDHTVWMGGKEYPANFVRITDNGIEPIEREFMSDTGKPYEEMSLEALKHLYDYVMGVLVKVQRQRLDLHIKYNQVIESVRCIPKSIIFNGTTTICIFGDGTKVISRPQKGEKFDKETGVAMCIAKYIYGSRSKFLKAIEKGHQQ